MAEINVKVCMGTTCFVKGGHNLQELNEIVSKRYGDKVKVSGCNCLGLCSINWEHSKAPYAKVNNEVVTEATVNKILGVIDSKLESTLLMAGASVK